MEQKPVVVSCTYNEPVEKVWNALTLNDHLKKWYFQLEEFKAEPGFKFQFWGGPEEGPHFLHQCEITQVVPLERLAYTWKYDGYAGQSEVFWELKPVDGGTYLELSHYGIESFAENGKDFSKESFNGGWNYFLNDALKIFLSS